MGRTIEEPTWETLGVPEPTTLEEAGERIAAVKRALDEIEPFIRRTPPADGSRRWTQYVEQRRMFDDKAAERRLLGHWIQVTQRKAKEDRRRRAAEADAARPPKATSDPLDVMRIGRGLRDISKAWARLIKVVVAAARFVDAEETSDDGTDAYLALVKAVNDARAEGYLLPDSLPEAGPRAE